MDLAGSSHSCGKIESDKFGESETESDARAGGWELQCSATSGNRFDDEIQETKSCRLR